MSTVIEFPPPKQLQSPQTCADKLLTLPPLNIDEADKLLTMLFDLGDMQAYEDAYPGALALFQKITNSLCDYTGCPRSQAFEAVDTQ